MCRAGKRGSPLVTAQRPKREQAGTLKIASGGMATELRCPLGVDNMMMMTYVEVYNREESATLIEQQGGKRRPLFVSPLLCLQCGIGFDRVS